MERTLAISARPRQPDAFDAERIVRDVPEVAIQSLASEIVPKMAALDIGGVGYQGYGAAGGSWKRGKRRATQAGG